jgi:hypothetical protein
MIGELQSSITSAPFSTISKSWGWGNTIVVFCDDNGAEEIEQWRGHSGFFDGDSKTVVLISEGETVEGHRRERKKTLKNTGFLRARINSAVFSSHTFQGGARTLRTRLFPVNT